MDHEDATLFDEDRLVNMLTSSPTTTLSSSSSSPTEENSLPRTRSLALRARRNNMVLPSLSTSPTTAPTLNAPDHGSPPVSSSQTSSSSVNTQPDTSSHSISNCISSSPIPIPCTNPACSSSSSSKNHKPPTAKDLETQCAKAQDTIDISDFECSLCFRVFFQPVTTVCGHVFCKQCLFSALKFSLHCPLCRQKLECSSTPSKYSVNVVLMNMIEKYFPKELQERVEEEGQWQSKQCEASPKQRDEEAIVARPQSPSWSCILPTLRSTCTVILSCGGF